MCFLKLQRVELSRPPYESPKTYLHVLFSVDIKGDLLSKNLCLNTVVWLQCVRQCAYNVKNQSTNFFKIKPINHEQSL